MFLLPLPLLFAGLGAIGRGSAAEMLGELGGFAGLMLVGLAAERGAARRGGLRRPRRRPAAGDPAQALRRGADRRQRRARRACSSLGQAPLGARSPSAWSPAAAQLLAFGLDPMRKKGLEGVDEFATERVARAIDQAEALVRQTADAAKRIGDRRLEGRVERLCDQAREVFRVVEQDPRDLEPGADLPQRLPARPARRDGQVRRRLEPQPRRRGAHGTTRRCSAISRQSFATHRTHLLEDDRSDLDIEIEVLRERLQQDGLIAR